MSAVTVLEELHRADPSATRVSLDNLELEQLDPRTLEYLQTHFSNLRYLSLRSNGLGDLPANFALFVPKLVALDVEDNPFQSIPRVSEALAPCSSLQSLRISLRNKTDERVLRVVLPKLRVLNGSAIHEGDSVATRPHALSLDLIDTSSSSNGSMGSTSPSLRWIDTPPSAPASAVRPVYSPQEKRELRLHLAKQTAKPSPLRKTYSMKPTEVPATISDDKTDWRKLLKKTKSADAVPPTTVPPPVTERRVNTRTAAATKPTEPTKSTQQQLSTRAFISELKSIIHSFHKRNEAVGRSAKPTEEQQLFDQLERNIDSLALQLNRLEQQPGQQDGRSDGHIAAASLAARWRLVDAGVSYATQKASAVDKTLGLGLQRLAKTQTQVVEALLRHVNEAIYAQQKWEAASRSQESVAEQQKQQMKLLLDVAETLEKDLESLQAKYQEERSQREQMQASNQALRSECDDLKKRIDGAKVEETISSTEASDKTQPRRIRKRNEATARPPSPINRQDMMQRRPPSPKASPVSPPRQPQPVVRSLTLKQLVDLIHCILASKAKYDSRLQSIGAPPETIEQHMYTYLNQRFGLQPLIVEYAAAIWKGCQAYTREDNDVAMFHAMLRNQVDEEFVGIKHKLQQAVRELLRAYFLAKHPMKPEASIQQMVEARLHGGLMQVPEWTEVLTYLYDPSDSSLLLRLVKRKAESYATSQQQQQLAKQPRQATDAAVLPFPVFEKLLFDYQLQGRLRLLEGFRQLFATHDSERVGVVTRDQFRHLVTEVATRKSEAEVDKMMQKLDPFNHDTITFSNAVRCLLQDIRHQSLSRKATATGTTKTR